MTEQSARVDVLTAEVRALMVGSRQITMSVYRQLDTVPPEQIEPFGRVRDKRTAAGYVEVVGRSSDGTLARSELKATPGAWIELTTRDDYEQIVEMAASFATSKWDLPQPTGFGVYVSMSNVGDWRYPPTDTPDGTWKYASPAKERDATATAERLLDAAVKTRDAAASWEALPLIVLAGLR